jgi:hypothetical protein
MTLITSVLPLGMLRLMAVAVVGARAAAPEPRLGPEQFSALAIGAAIPAATTAALAMSNRCLGRREVIIVTSVVSTGLNLQADARRRAGERQGLLGMVLAIPPQRRAAQTRGRRDQEPLLNAAFHAYGRCHRLHPSAEYREGVLALPPIEVPAQSRCGARRSPCPRTPAGTTPSSPPIRRWCGDDGLRLHVALEDDAGPVSHPHWPSASSTAAACWRVAR